jgi:hypothetical protein
MYYVETVALCHYCHSYIHVGRMQALLEQGKITHAKYAAVIQHGDSVLAMAGLCRPLPHTGETAPWQAWRLVLDGKEYPPLYETFDEWKKAFGHA